MKGSSAPGQGRHPRCIAFGTLESYMNRFQLSHWDTPIPGETRENGATDSSSDSLKQEVCQTDWLWQWWSDR